MSKFKDIAHSNAREAQYRMDIQSILQQDELSTSYKAYNLASLESERSIEDSLFCIQAIQKANLQSEETVEPCDCIEDIKSKVKVLQLK